MRLKKLSTRVVLPIILAIILSLGLVTVILTKYVRDDVVRLNTYFLMLKTSRLYHLCETAVGELTISNSIGLVKVVEAKKEITLAEIDYFLSEEQLDYLVLQEGRVVAASVTPTHLPVLQGYAGTTVLQTARGQYHGYYMHFPVWNWHLVTLVRDEVYWERRQSAAPLMAMVVAIYVLLPFLVFGILRFKLQKPISLLLKELKSEGKVSSLSGTEELDILSTTINSTVSSLRKLSNAVDQAAEGVMITDIRGAIEYVNPAFEWITGYAKEEIVGRNPRLLKSGAHPEAFYRQMWETILRGEIWSGTVVNRKKDGGLYTEELTITPVRDPFGAITDFVAIRKDITERMKLESQLRQSQKMESIGVLAGGVAHDFNNILTGVIGYTGLILGQLREDDPSYHYAKQVEKLADKAASLTRQLLAFSRRQVLEMRPVNINDVLKDLEEMLPRVIGEDIALTVVLTDAPVTVMADPHQIEQVVLNLAVNAKDAMPRGGRLTLSTSVVEVTKEYGHEYVKPGRYMVIAVEDSGAGMGDEVLKKIFEPFYTTKEKGKGTGLGLAVSYGIIKQHNGYVHVASTPGAGTTFEILLPEAVSGRGEEAPAGEYKPSQGGHETVLVAEDEEAVRELISSLLEAQGYRVLSAKNGVEALRLAETGSETIDLLVTDVVMPEMGGKELAERLKSERTALEVVFISGYTNNALFEENILKEGVNFLQKPFKASQLIQAVRKALDRGAKV